MSSPALPSYAATPFNPDARPGVVWALLLGQQNRELQPTADGTPYQQRDINEMVSRGWVKRLRQRAGDRFWTWTLTREGLRVAGELGC